MFTWEQIWRLLFEHLNDVRVVTGGQFGMPHGATLDSDGNLGYFPMDLVVVYRVLHRAMMYKGIR